MIRVGGGVERNNSRFVFVEFRVGLSGNLGRLVHVLDGVGGGNGVSSIGRVGGGHGDRVTGLVLAVEFNPGSQLAGGLDDLKVVGGANGVGQPVVVGVGGRTGAPKLLPTGAFSRMLRS